MIGAIIGDIAGSCFEFDNYRKKDFELFSKESFVTDDSIMTLAVAKSIMDTKEVLECPGKKDACYEELKEMTVKNMQEIGRKYPDCGYGGMFGSWIFSDNPKPYNSFGNGAAMRISPVGFIAKSREQAVLLSDAITGVTHNHKEGYKGAEATVAGIYMARQGLGKEEIQKEIEKDYYPLDFNIEDIRETYTFNETCQGTIPQAIKAFLESDSFEDAIRTAISIGGDSDTLAAITGSIAQAYYGVPESLEEKALTHLDNKLLEIYEEWKIFRKEVLEVK